MSRQVMSGVRPTRIELLKLRKREMLAQKGHDLLQEKLDAMVMEESRILKEVETMEYEIRTHAIDSYSSLFAASLSSGWSQIEEITWAVREIPDVPMGIRQIMGIRVPKMDPPDYGDIRVRGYSFAGISGQVDDAVIRFERYLAFLIRYAEREGTLRKLRQEISGTRRRVNALEHIVIPRLKKTQQYIEMHLEEREREDLFRRKRSKQLLEKKN